MSGILESMRAVRIFVNELDRARQFYGNVLELPETAAGLGYAVFDLGEAQVIVEAVAGDDHERQLVGRFLAVSFTCKDDIDAVYRRLVARGVSFVQPPEKQAWGGTLAFPRDPDGNVLTLVEYPRPLPAGAAAE